MQPVPGHCNIDQITVATKQPFLLTKFTAKFSVMYISLYTCVFTELKELSYLGLVNFVHVSD